MSPAEGLDLLRALRPEALLLSAYDVWFSRRESDRFRALSRDPALVETATVLDSGNYEAYRFDDRYSEKNPNGWSREKFHDVALFVEPDLAFAFDTIERTASATEVIAKTVHSYEIDHRALAARQFALCPIVHIPDRPNGEIASFAASIIKTVASEIDAPLIAVPERELGNGIGQRMRSVKAIRSALNELNHYYPLHILGTGNPLSVLALAAAGADGFDGLEWCRTVVDYERGYLFHFQHFDFFAESQRFRVEHPLVRKLLDSPDSTYAMRTLSFNVDYFRSSTKTLQRMIAAGLERDLLNELPGSGALLLKE